MSIALHLVGFGAAGGLPLLIPRQSGPPPIYVVDLVSLPAGRPRVARRPVAPSAPPARKPPAPKPEPEKKIAIPDPVPRKTPVPEKPKPKKTPEPTQTPPPSDESTDDRVEETATTGPQIPDGTATAAAGPGVSGIGVAGLGGEGSARADAYTFYLSLLDRKIRGAWQRPVYFGRQALEATVRMTLTSSGRLSSLELTESSGFDLLDRSAMRAVRDAGSFPPFPYDLGLDSLTVQVVFDLTPQGSPEGD